MSEAAFYNTIRPMFGSISNSQLAGIKIILAATAHLPVAYRAYIFATAHHETGTRMQPIREANATSDDSAVRILDNAWKKGQLKSVKTPYWRKDADGKAWFGRGYVQLTHKYNYQRASDLTGIDLVSDPSASMRPDVAAKILVEGSVKGMFTGLALSKFLDKSTPDYVGARQVINGHDKASLIAGYARTYEKALRQLPVSAPAPTPKPQPEPAPVIVPDVEPVIVKPLPIDTPAVDVPDTPTPPSVLGALMALWFALFRR